MNYTESCYSYCHHAPRKNWDKLTHSTVSCASRQIHELRKNVRYNIRKEIRYSTVV